MVLAEITPRRAALRLLCALAALALRPGLAPAQQAVPLTLDPSSTILYRVTLAGHQGLWSAGPLNAAVSIGAPPGLSSGPVTLQGLHFGIPYLNCQVAVAGASPVAVTLTNLSVDAAGSGVALPSHIAPDGQSLLFSGAPVPTSAQGAANYAAVGLACNALQADGAPCSGPFTLAPPGSNAPGMVESGSLAAAANPRAVSFVFFASFPLAPGATWGSLDVRADLRGTLPGTPTCPADFNGASGLTVQDIFDFLSAWFIGNTNADFNRSGGLTVQDIFDFLGAWFAGC
jgi:hypothetical protein